MNSGLKSGVYEERLKEPNLWTLKENKNNV